MELKIPLVGMHFRPPAKEVVQCLPVGTELILRAEPTNEHDPNAVRVLVDLRDFPESKYQLLQNMIGPVYDAEQLCSEGLFMLGYLATSGKKTARGGAGNIEVLLMCSNAPQASSDIHLDGISARLDVAPEGHHIVVVTQSPEEESIDV